jgi:hypothetical protein
MRDPIPSDTTFNKYFWGGQNPQRRHCPFKSLYIDSILPLFQNPIFRGKIKEVNDYAYDKEILRIGVSQ